MINQADAIQIYDRFLNAELCSTDWYTKISPHIKATLLYGSVAKGTNKQDSDIDILLIVPLEIEETYTKGEYVYDYDGYEINIVLRSIERLREIAKEQQDIFQKEVFRDALIITSSDSEVKELLALIEKI